MLYDSDFDIDDGITVNRYMRLWTEQAGFPLINVESANDGSAVVVTQVPIYFYQGWDFKALKIP